MINSIACINKIDPKESIILLYSGGLDSTFLLAKLAIERGHKVTVLKIDIGQKDKEIKSNWNNPNITMCRINAVSEFVENYVKKAILNGGKYLGTHPLSASLSRPFLAQTAYKMARNLNSRVIIHSATSHQNSLRRFNGALLDLGFDGLYGSPFAKDEISRDEKIAFLNSHGIEVPKKRAMSFDSNIWASECEAGDPVNPSKIDYPDSFFNPKKENPKELEISFKNGIPISLNGKRSDLFEIIQKLNDYAGIFGNYITFEENPQKEKMIEIRKTPAAEIIGSCYFFLLTKNLDHETILHKNYLDQLWCREASEGRWFGDLKKSIESFNKTIAKKVNGRVTCSTKNSQIILSSINELKKKNIIIKKVA